MGYTLPGLMLALCILSFSYFLLDNCKSTYIAKTLLILSFSSYSAVSVTVSLADRCFFSMSALVNSSSLQLETSSSLRLFWS